jgi:hypothetical protein
LHRVRRVLPAAHCDRQAGDDLDSVPGPGSLLGGRRLITRSGDDATWSELLAGMLGGEIFPAVHPPDRAGCFSRAVV